MTALTEEVVERLRERAENAIEVGANPWLWDGEELDWEDDISMGFEDEPIPGAFVRQGARLHPTDIIVQSTYEGSEHHAEFIAQANPHTVLALLDHIEDLEDLVELYQEKSPLEVNMAVKMDHHMLVGEPSDGGSLLEEDHDVE